MSSATETADDVESAAWGVVAILTGQHSFPVDLFCSVKQFVKRLGLSECRDAAEIAVSRKGYIKTNSDFRFFCGICWNKIRDQDDEE